MQISLNKVTTYLTSSALSICIKKKVTILLPVSRVSATSINTASMYFSYL